MKISALPLSQPTSFFLDVLRLLAAFSVFFVHVRYLWYRDSFDTRVMHLGHRAVIVFFVLSGYVIAHSTLRKALDARAYVSARLSRLYSVLLPALLLTAVLQIVGTWLNPHFYHPYDRGHDVLRYGLVALFLQSIWFTNAAPPTDGPFWSLCYEFWYYALFGVAVMVKSVRWKIGSLLVLALVCGVNVLLLMPNWLMGVACYCYGRRVTMPKLWAFWGWASLSLMALLGILVWTDLPYAVPHRMLFQSGAFISDATLGVLLTLSIWFFDQAFRSAKVPDWLDAWIRWLADHTFSLYLYHFPLLFFVVAVVPFDRASLPQTGAMILLVFAIILGLSVFTESKRPGWRKLFGGIWDNVASRLPA